MRTTQLAQARPPSTPAPRALSKQDIDRRIEAALSAVFEADGREAAHPLAPRWIAAAELVRRVSPLLSRN